MRFHGNEVKIGVRNRKKNSLQASFFLLSLNFLLKRCVKESITAFFSFFFINIYLITALLMTILTFTWRKNKNSVHEIKEKYNVTTFTTN